MLSGAEPLEYRLDSDSFEWRWSVNEFKRFSMSQSTNSLRIYKETDASRFRRQIAPYHQWKFRLVVALALVIGVQVLLGVFEAYTKNPEKNAREDSQSSTLFSGGS